MKSPLSAVPATSRLPSLDFAGADVGFGRAASLGAILVSDGQDRLERHLRRLRGALNLWPDQEPAFHRFAEALRQRRRVQTIHAPRAGWAADDLVSLWRAVNGLLASLNAEQRLAFDRNMVLRNDDNRS
jgi:hypothetical protein